METTLTGVHPAELMRAIQRYVVDGSDATLLVESGNCFGWANRHLRFKEPGRYRASMTWGSLGHASAGVVGVALVRGGKAVALCGDGAMLFGNEISTAVAARLDAVWLVVNDAGYGSCIAGQRSRSLSCEGLAIPRVDFAAYARSLGAEGTRVDSAPQLDSALSLAMQIEGPYLVDVWVQTAESPLDERFAQLFGGSDSSSGFTRPPKH